MQTPYSPVLAGIVRILDTMQHTVGTGFVISTSRDHTYGLVMTSTRIVEQALSFRGLDIYGKLVHMVFHIDPKTTIWDAVVEDWMPSNQEDVCILRVEGKKLPNQVRPLPLSSITNPEGRRVSIFGYNSGPQTFVGAWRYSEMCRPGPRREEAHELFLQLEIKSITEGYNGAPVWDDARRRVLGMITFMLCQDQPMRGTEDIYAVPVEILQNLHASVLLDHNLDIQQPIPLHSSEPFSEGEAAWFRGYEEVTDRMVHLLNDHPKFLTVIGPAQSGKTSVIQAGLIPKFRSGEIQSHSDWDFFKAHISKDPFKELATQGLERGEASLMEGIDTWCHRHPGLNLVFILDQFENFLYNCPFDIQKDFVEQLLEVLDKNHTIILIIVLRDSSYNLLSRHEALMKNVEEHLINVFSPHTKEALVDIASNRNLPEELQKTEVLEHIAEKALASVNSHDVLYTSAIAQYERMLEQVVTTSKQLRNIETVVDLDTLSTDLNDWAENIFQSLDEEQQAFIKRVIRRTVAIESNQQSILNKKHAVPLDIFSCSEIEYELIYTLADKGLFITDRNRQTDQETVTLAQDALIYEWQRLRNWLDTDRQFLLWQQNFLLQHNNWIASNVTSVEGRDRDKLLQGFELAEAEKWQKEYANDFDAQALLFIETSQRYRQQKEHDVRSLYEEVRQLKESVEETHLLGLAQRLVAHAKSVFAKYPHLVQESVLLAALSLSLVPSPEADQVLRAGLALLPRRVPPISVRADISAAALSRDGHYIAIAYENDIEIVDLINKQIRFHISHEVSIDEMAFHPSGSYLVAANENGEIWAWILQHPIQGVLYQEAPVEREPSIDQEFPLTKLLFSPSGRYLAVTRWHNSLGELSIWESSRWHLMYREAYSSRISSISFSADDTTCAIGCVDGVVKMHNLSGIYNNVYKKIHFQKAYRNQVNTIALSRGANYLAIGHESGEVVVLKLGLAVKTIVRWKHKKRVRAVLFSPVDTHLITVSDDATVGVWSIPSGRKLQPLVHKGPVYAYTFSHDNVYLATVSEDHTVRIWNIETSKEMMRFSHGEYIETLSFSMEKRILFTVSDDRTVRVWNIAQSDQCKTLPQHSSIPLRGIAWQPNTVNYIFAVNENSRDMKIWNVGSEPKLQNILHHKKLVNALLYSPEGGYIATLGEDKAAFLWKTENGEQIAKLTHVHCIAFSHNERLIAIGYNAYVIIQDVIYGHQKAKITLDQQVNAVAFNVSDDSLAIGCDTGEVCLWKWQEASSDYQLMPQQHNGAVNTIRFSHDGRYWVTTGNDHVAYLRAWESAVSKYSHELRHNDYVSGACFSPDGEFVATTCAGRNVYVWHSQNGSQKVVLSHQGQINDVAFSPKGQYIATASNDNTVGIWDVLSGRQIVSLAHSDHVYFLAFSSDGRYLATGCRDGGIKIWLWLPEDLITEVCHCITRNLTLEEWQKYAGNEPYRRLCDDLP